MSELYGAGAHAPTDELLCPKAAAAYLGLTVATLEGWRITGKGPAYIKLGNGRTAAIRYRISVLNAWLERQTRNSTSEEVPGDEDDSE